MYEYKHFVIAQEELEGELNFYGSTGWRLHTCEPVLTFGQKGSGIILAFVVMDRLDQPEDKPQIDQKVSPQGIAMRG